MGRMGSVSGQEVTGNPEHVSDTVGVVGVETGAGRVDGQPDEDGGRHRHGREDTSRDPWVTGHPVEKSGSPKTVSQGDREGLPGWLLFSVEVGVVLAGGTDETKRGVVLGDDRCETQTNKDKGR